jgi:hypothetical protein
VFIKGLGATVSLGDAYVSPNVLLTTVAGNSEHRSAGGSAALANCTEHITRRKVAAVVDIDIDILFKLAM